MKAILQRAAVPPKCARRRDVEGPTVDGDAELVEVSAASVNALDWHATRGMPYLVRSDRTSGGPNEPSWEWS